jgi:hypothetical protein
MATKYEFGDEAVANYFNLTKMKSISLSLPFDRLELSELGLNLLLAKKELLIQLELHNCLSHNKSNEYQCLSTLTNLSSLTIHDSGELFLNKIRLRCCMLKNLLDISSGENCLICRCMRKLL